MSKLAPARAKSLATRPRFAIVASRFNQRYVDALLDHATAELRALAPAARIDTIRVPGAFEIPVAVRELASRKKADAIIALGVILKGKTSHAKNLAISVSHALQAIALEHRTPVIHAVLSLDNEAQARERCLGNKMNRGTEAARTAVEIAGVMVNLRKKN